MSIIGDGIVLGAGGEKASIFVTGLSQTDTVTCTKDGKSYKGKWKKVSKEVEYSIPKMTSNTAPSGVASASKEVAGEGEAYKAFDGSDGTYAYGGDNAIPWTLQYDFEKIVSIDYFSYKAGQPSADGSRTGAHEVSISTDGISWEIIHTGTETSGWTNPKSETIYLDTKKQARYIRWVTTSMTGNSNPSECVVELQVHGYTEVDIDGLEFTVNDYGTYTITATDGTDTATQDVLVDSADTYNVEISYRNIDENIVLLIDGNNIEDISAYQRAIANTGVTLSDAQTKFFDKSLYFNGSAILQFEAYTLGTGDFTIDFWMYNTATSNAYRRWVTGSNGGFGSGTFCIRENAAGGIQTQNVTSSTNIPRNQWVHIAAVRSNGTLKIYLNGTEIASTSDSTDYSEAIKYIGGYYNSIGNETFVGYLDEIRISNIARWTSNFTPPSRPY